jgi:hypothetical protein
MDLSPPVSATVSDHHAGCASRPIDHMKPTSSRAIAVHTIVVFLPLALRALYRAVSRTCAFQAISRTLGEVASNL